jgi:hypothetical protein
MHIRGNIDTAYRSVVSTPATHILQMRVHESPALVPSSWDASERMTSSGSEESLVVEKQRPEAVAPKTMLEATSRLNRKIVKKLAPVV